MIIMLVILALVLVIMAKAIAFKPAKQTEISPKEVKADVNKARENLQKMIQCKTISYVDRSLQDMAEFKKFQDLLENLYPNVHKVATREFIDATGILYTIKGQSSEKPSVYMSHYDVVPVSEKDWTVDPFEAVFKEECVWGRGTIDTKGTLLGVMEATEQLLADGFVPKNDIYLAFSGDEEVNGNGQPAIVEEFIKRGVKPAMVLDEGGAVVENVFPGVKSQCALIGIAEKGMLNIELSINGKGGHASTPPPHTPVGVLSKAVVKIENNPFKTEFTKPAKEMFDTLGRHSSFGYKILFANLWLFRPILNMICSKSGGELNALMRTTCAFTMMQGSDAPNVIPPNASVSANLRLIGSETTESAKQKLEKIANNSDISFKIVNGMNPSQVSETGCDAWDRVVTATRQTWDNTIVSPYLMIACSDSRHYHKISDKVYRFSPMEMSKQVRSTIHGHDEKISTEQIRQVVEFYLRIISES